MTDTAVEEFTAVDLSDVPVLREAVSIDMCAISAGAWSERLASSGVTALFTNVTWPRDTLAEAMLRIYQYKRAIAAEDRFRVISTVDDIRRCKTDGKVGQILGAHNVDWIGYNVELVGLARDAGLRFVQLNYNERNLASDGCLEDTNVGLSNLGREIVAAMNENGLLLDLADAGIQSSLDAIEVSTKPLVFSHNNPRAVAIEQQRNVSDEQIQAVAAKGGVVALVPHTPLAATTPDVYPTVVDVIRHIEYVVDLVGIDHVAIGSDSEAAPGRVSAELSFQMGHVGRHNRNKPNTIGSVSRSLGIAKERTSPMSYFEMVQALQHGAWGVTGMEHIGKLPTLVAELQRRGWSDEHLTKLLGENMLRVFEANWTV